MKLEKILTPARTESSVNISSKKRLLEYLSRMISSDLTNVKPEEVFDALITRERLGSTGIGGGVAIPHCRVESTEQIVGAFVSLNEAIDFDANDNKKVDIFFLLLVPLSENEAHLEILATLAEIFRDAEFRDKIRSIESNEELYLALKNKENAQSNK